MIIGINGRIGNGKDLVGKIIQCLANRYNDKDIISYVTNPDWVCTENWQIKKFADKLKDIVCLLTGCTREQLEDQEFKNKELDQEWWYYRLSNTKIVPRFYFPTLADNQMAEERYLIKPTYRMLLQQIGTDLFRDKLHENVWVNSLMSGYKKNELSHYKLRESGREYFDEDPVYKYPNWIITDMRFPNELKAVKDRDGISIRVKRGTENPNNDVQNGIPLSTILSNYTHPSETALDNVTFNWEINNDGTIEELIEKVREVLVKEKII